MATANKPAKKAASKDIKVTEVKKVVKVKPVVKTGKVDTPKPKAKSTPLKKAPAKTAFLHITPGNEVKEMKLNNIKPVKAVATEKLTEATVKQVQEVTSNVTPSRVISVKELTAAINQKQQPVNLPVTQPVQEPTARKSMSVKEMMSRIATSVASPFKRK